MFAAREESYRLREQAWEEERRRVEHETEAQLQEAQADAILAEERRAQTVARFVCRPAMTLSLL